LKRVASDKANPASKIPSRTSPRKGVASDKANLASEIPSHTSPQKGIASDKANPAIDFMSPTLPQKGKESSSMKRKASDNVETRTTTIEALPEGHVATVVPAKPKGGQKLNSSKATTMAAKQTMTRKDEDPFLDRLVSFASDSEIGEALISSFGDAWFEEAWNKLIDKDNGDIIEKVRRHTKVSGKKIIASHCLRYCMGVYFLGGE
jgi:hypothetical protein